MQDLAADDATCPDHAPRPIAVGALSAVPGVVHGFFTREGGVSRGVYAGLNCGYGSRDERAAVAQNRRRVAATLDLPGERLLTVHQVHSANALVATAPHDPLAAPKADALVTDRPGLAVAALAADCAPVLFADRGGRAVAAAHAGWRGALSGILEATVDAMGRLGARRSDIVAVVGPCISAAAYEVGPEFRATFLAADPGYERFFTPGARETHPMFHLAAFCVHRLAAAGVGTVESVGDCTYRDETRFFSYRRACHRGEDDYGRLVSAIALRP